MCIYIRGLKIFFIMNIKLTSLVFGLAEVEDVASSEQSLESEVKLLDLIPGATQFSHVHIPHSRHPWTS